MTLAANELAANFDTAIDLPTAYTKEDHDPCDLAALCFNRHRTVAAHPAGKVRILSDNVDIISYIE